MMTLDTDLACCDARRGAGRSVSGGCVAQSAFRVPTRSCGNSVTNRCRRSRAPRGHREKKRARRPRTRARVATRGMPARHAQRARRARPSRARSRRSRSRLLHERTGVWLRRISHARARARVARRTWTLDALRAATEPVKVEAMQAIVVVWCLVEEGCVCRNGDRDARRPVKKQNIFAFFANHHGQTDSKRRHSLAVKRQPRPAEKAIRSTEIESIRKRSGIWVFLTATFHRAPVSRNRAFERERRDVDLDSQFDK